jgi:cystathionine beta-lyase/cystathionine gamma-synthase
MELDDIIFHLGENRSEYHNAVVPPVYQTSNFIFDSIEDFKSKVADELANFVYTRGNNPTVKILRQKIAALEGCDDALITGSGMAAISLALISQLKSGDHVICIKKPYSWTNRLIRDVLSKLGVGFDFFDADNLEGLKSLIKSNTRVIYLESPNSLTMEVQDLKSISSIAKAGNITTIIDNSYSTPIFQRPKEFGIDIIVHSATKYLNGHSDVMAGVICGDKSVIYDIFNREYMIFGPSVSPHDAALMLRGLRTLPIRIQRTEMSTQKVLEYLRREPLVRRIYYPFTDSGQDIAKTQMVGCGGLFSIELETEFKADVHTFIQNLDKFFFAVSWGGYESLKLPVLAFYDNPGRPNPALPFQLIRLYIGLEEPDYLISNLKKAFDSIRQG